MKKLLILMSLLSIHAYAAIDCTTLWNRGFPDLGRQRVSFDCVRTLTRNPNINIYISNELSDVIDVIDLENLKTDLKASLVKSYAKYDALGDMPAIKAVLYHRPHYNDSPIQITYAEASTNTPMSGESCPVIIYPSSLTFNRNHFKQIIAHELFHCYQWKNYKAKVDLGVNSALGKWWLEGTAQFMSNYVYPDYDMEYDSSFAPYSPLTPLPESEANGYGNVHFFQSLFNQSDANPSSIINFIGLMPTSSGMTQTSALARVNNIGPVFHHYAESMAVPSLIDSSGRRAPVNAAVASEMFEVNNLGGVFNKEFIVTPYTIYNVSMALPTGYNYKISMTADDNVKYSIRETFGNTWNELPYEIEGSCEEYKVYEIMLTATGSNLDSALANIKVESEESLTCPCAGATIDQCMVGNWKLDPNSMEDLVRAMIGDEAEVTRVEGYETMSLDRTGLAKINIGWEGEGNGDMGGTPTHILMTMLGGYQVELFKKEPGKICANMIKKAVIGNMKVTANGMSFNIPLGDNTPYDSSERLDYTCNQREFVISTVIPPGDSGRDTPININWRYLRQ